MPFSPINVSVPTSGCSVLGSRLYRLLWGHRSSLHVLALTERTKPSSPWYTMTLISRYVRFPPLQIVLF